MGLSTYNRETIEEGLFALWDPDVGFGSTRPDDPDPDMPKGPSGDPSHGGTILAVRADLSRAWDRTALTEIERRRVFMAYALCWPTRVIAEHEGRDRKAVIKSLESGLSKITRFLNGEPEGEECGDE